MNMSIAVNARKVTNVLYCPRMYISVIINITPSSIKAIQVVLAAKLRLEAETIGFSSRQLLIYSCYTPKSVYHCLKLCIVTVTDI